MAKILNLDEMVPEERTLIHKGVEHEVGKLTLGDYLRFQKANEEYVKAGNEMDKMQYGLKAVRLVIPTLPEEEVAGLHLSQLMALMDFVTEAMGVITKAESDASPNSPAPAA